MTQAEGGGGKVADLKGRHNGFTETDGEGRSQQENPEGENGPVGAHQYRYEEVEVHARIRFEFPKDLRRRLPGLLMIGDRFPMRTERSVPPALGRLLTTRSELPAPAC